MPIVLIWDYLRDDTSLHFTVSLINQTACIGFIQVNTSSYSFVNSFPFIPFTDRDVFIALLIRPQREEGPPLLRQCVRCAKV